MHILFPTDGSFISRNGFDVALYIASRAKGVIHSVYVVSEGSSIVDKLIEEQIAGLAEAANAVGVEFSFESREGDLLNVLSESISDYGIDLVIMATHGKSGKHEWFLGSNTIKCVRSISVPILVVRNSFKDKIFKNVVFATAFEKRDANALVWLIEFLKIFDISNLHLLNVNTSSWFSSPGVLIEEGFDKLIDSFSELTFEVHYYQDFSVDAGIRNFAQEHDIDLIVLPNHGANVLRRSLLGSNVEMLVNHSELPVLALKTINL